MTKKNYRKLPAKCAASLEQIHGDVIVATVRNVKSEEIQNGLYAKFGLTSPTASGYAYLPEAEQGRYSKWNIEGREIVRRDLPKYEKTYSFDVPCFGNWNHMVTVTQSRMVYPRDLVPAESLMIQMEVVAPTTDGGCVAKFQIGKVLVRSSETFDRELLSAVNLLHESVASVGVFPESMLPEEFLRHAAVPWQILPAGSHEERVTMIVGNGPKVSPELRSHVSERLTFLESLAPSELIYGDGGMDGYVGAAFGDDLVVFENMRDGNALYVMFADWRHLSQQTKTELLAKWKPGVDYVRFFHTEGWQARVMEFIEGRRKKAA